MERIFASACLDFELRPINRTLPETAAPTKWFAAPLQSPSIEYEFER
jgi:hypothetical protein